MSIDRVLKILSSCCVEFFLIIVENKHTNEGDGPSDTCADLPARRPTYNRRHVYIRVCWREGHTYRMGVGWMGDESPPRPVPSSLSPG